MDEKRGCMACGSEVGLISMDNHVLCRACGDPENFQKAVEVIKLKKTRELIEIKKELMHPEFLYQVVERKTPNLQLAGYTVWHEQVLYCGYDRKEARRVYHEHTVTDSDSESVYGRSWKRTFMQVIADAGTNDFSDDYIVTGPNSDPA